MSQRPEFARVVRPRKSHSFDRRIIATDGTSLYLERTGEVFGLDRLATLICSEPPSIFVAHNVGVYLQRLDRALDSNPFWQFKLTPVKREVWKPNRERFVTHTQSVVSFFGFMSEDRKANRYHYALDPIVFQQRSVGELWSRDTATLTALVEWAQDVRSFVVENELRISPSSGGLAGQLLKDPRFYPEPRRKVPKATNEAARERMPGNFYSLIDARVGKIYRATYLDQRTSHHTIAESTPLPSSNSLFARGHFLRIANDGTCHRAWIRGGTRAFEKFRAEHHGLLYCRVITPKVPKFAPPFMASGIGESYQFIFTNEIDDLYANGGRILSVVAAWTSTEVDTGISKYARWAKEQSELAGPNRRRWLKPTLLSAYGLLAARPKELEFGFKRGRGIDRLYPVGSGVVAVKATRTRRKIELPICNVIQRGMIEAETRARSLRLARELDSCGHRILAVYADSIFVDSGQPLPLLPPEWRIQEHLTSLRFHAPTAFTSLEMSKLPGIPRDSERRIYEARSVLAGKPRRNAA